MDINDYEAYGNDLIFNPINEKPSIEETGCQGECDKHWFDVYFENGSKHRIFNPNEVIYEGENNV